MVIFFNFSPTSSHLHPLQVENCDSNSRLVVDEDDNGKLRLEKVKSHFTVSFVFCTSPQHVAYIFFYEHVAQHALSSAVDVAFPISFKW